MENKKHHYVPICYLKQFAYEKDSIIHVYDKVNDKSFPRNIKDICYENFLYKLSNDYLNFQNDTSLNPLSIENEYFAESLESDFDKILEWIRNVARNKYETGCHYFGLTDDSKFILAKNIAIQYLRTPFIRDFIVTEEKRVEEKILRLFKQGVAIEENNPGILDLPLEAEIDKVSCHATNTYLDDEYVCRIANHLANSYWHFYYSPFEQFYSSDNPVTIIHRYKDVMERDYGLTDYGAEISFPLNPCLLLTIYDYQYFHIYNATDGLFEEAVKEHIDYANICQVAFSKRIVFNKTGDFTSAIRFCRGK